MKRIIHEVKFGNCYNCPYYEYEHFSCEAPTDKEVPDIDGMGGWIKDDLINKHCPLNEEEYLIKVEK